MLEESPSRDEWYAMQRRRLLKFLKRSGSRPADMSYDTIGSLYALWEAQDGAYEHIFPSMTAGYNPRFKVDDPMNAETTVRVVSGSGRRIGAEVDDGDLSAAGSLGPRMRFAQAWGISSAYA